jgi:hypothetical protein
VILKAKTLYETISSHEMPFTVLEINCRFVNEAKTVILYMDIASLLLIGYLAYYLKLMLDAPRSSGTSVGSTASYL